LRHAYDESLTLKGCGGSDGVLICGGTLRGDTVYGPGEITLGDIMEILPFEDPIVVVELDGETIWAALEAALYTWPAQEGRFPIVSGFRVDWDSTAQPGQRVKNIYFAEEDETDVTRGIIQHRNGSHLERKKGGRMYKIVTREYMATGHDGFDVLKGKPEIVDDENGVIMSTIVRKYLLGAQYIHRLKTKPETSAMKHLHPETSNTISRAKKRWMDATEMITQYEKMRASTGHSITEIGEALRIAGREHMASIDHFDGAEARRGRPSQLGGAKKGLTDLLVIAPVVDGRMRDLGRP